MPADGDGRLRFGEFEFDALSGTLFRGGHPVKIEPRPLRVLSVLLENAAEIVSREHLRKCVWGDTTFVEFDQGLNYCIRRIRLALRDEASRPLYIETLPKQGYRFIARVTIIPSPLIPADANQVYAGSADPDRIATAETIDPVQATTQDPSYPSRARTARNRFASYSPWLAAISFGLLATVGVWATWRNSNRVQPAAPLIFLPIDLGTGVSLFADNGPAMAISPDGTRVVFSSRDASGKVLLYWRRLDQPAVIPLPGTESAFSPFFSPDGKQLAFFADGRLRKIDLDTGIVTILANAVNPAGGDWDEHNLIVFNRAPTLDLWTISANGGEPTPIARDPNDTVSRYWPRILPGGKAILFTGIAGWQGDIAHVRVEAMLLKDHRRRTLVEGATFGRYAAGGNLLYVRNGMVFARRFDPERLEVSGPEVPVLNGVEYSTYDGAAQLDFSRTGTLVYRASRPGSDLKTVQWMDATGRLEPLLSTPGDYRAIKLSPDGRRLALAMADGSTSDVYVYDVNAGRPATRLTAGAGIPDSTLVWSRDGRYIFFRAKNATWWTPSDTASQPRQLVNGFNVSGITSDGTRLLVTINTPETRTDTWLLPFTEEREGPRAGKPRPLLRGPASEIGTSSSADGRWLAYAADETGDPEVYVTGLFNPDLKWPVSRGSGVAPSWSRTSHELFFPTFFSPMRIMVAPYTVEGGLFRLGQPRPWSQRAIPGRTDMGDSIISQSPDGKRFAVLMPVEEARNNRVVFVMSFFDEIRRRLAQAQ
jgi:DNA-binding winged helix-turn-helix (wHTH) protein/Tol biopolymer transport system component